MTRPNFTRIFWTSLVTVIALLAAVWFGGRYYLAQGVMPYSGSQPLDGLESPVEILFDGRGIPRIYADSDADALRALGWLHAGERLFQMELIRRVARGELAELIGPAALESDLLHRGFGFARRVADERPELDPDVETLIRAYVDGINQSMRTARRLPPEFVLLRAAPEPWTVDDVLTIAYYQSWFPNTLVQRLSEAWREIAETFGEPASDWLGRVPDWVVTSVPGQRIGEASNSWAVAPERSASGAALHASDPHLDYTMAPGLWYAAGIHSAGGLNVLGVTAPGLPFVAMGHNGQIAWSFTVAPVDVFELYHQQRHPEDAERVAGPDGWEPIHRHTETFQVRDLDGPIERQIAYTPRGLVLEESEDTVLVMHWAGFDFGLKDLLKNGLAINRAGNFDAFRDAVSNMGALSANWIYSDRAGHIGYVQGTPVPRRRHQQFFQVLDGADPNYGWDGYWPPDERPFAIDPDQGWLASANNHPVDADWPYPVPGYFKALRMRRIAAWLEQDRSFTPEDMLAMQLDQVSDRALAWKDWLANVAEDSGRDQIAAELRQWDGHMSAVSETAGLFARWWQHLPRHLFADLEEIDWRTARVVLDEWLHAPPEDTPLADIDRDAAALAALEQALRDGVRPLGLIQLLTIEHPMARAGLLNRWLNLSRGPIAMGGDAGSLNVTYSSFRETDSVLIARAGASMRFVIDWADPDAFTLNLTLGQSGHPLSPHFDDYLSGFLSGEPWVVPFSREAVEARVGTRLRLVH